MAYAIERTRDRPTAKTSADFRGTIDMTSPCDGLYALTFNTEPDIRYHTVDYIIPGSSLAYVEHNKTIDAVDIKVEEFEDYSKFHNLGKRFRRKEQEVLRIGMG